MVRIRVELEALFSATSHIVEDHELINSLIAHQGTLMDFMENRVRQMEDKLQLQPESIQRSQSV